MSAIIRYTLITALRDLLFIGLLAIALIAMYVSSFLGSTAVSEQGEMTISYMAGSTRLINVVGLVIFVCFHVRRSFENKEIEMILSKPISRTAFIISYWAGFALLAVIISFSLGVLMYGFAHSHHIGLLYWTGSIMCESLMMVAFAMLASLIFGSAVTSALSTLSFYFLARMMGYFVTAINFKPYAYLPTGDNFLHWFGDLILTTTSVAIPRLDLFGKSSWLIYGIEEFHDWMVFPIQSLIYIPFLLLMAIFDFRRKQF